MEKNFFINSCFEDTIQPTGERRTTYNTFIKKEIEKKYICNKYNTIGSFFKQC